MKMKPYTITRSLTLLSAVLLTACQASSAIDSSAVKVKLADGKYRTIEATVPSFTATVMKVNVQHNQKTFSIDSAQPTVTSQGVVTGGLFTPTAPEGAHWQLLSLEGLKVSVVGKRQPYIRMIGGQMQGLTGCNVMSGAYNRLNEKMQFIQVKGTNSVCAEMQQTEKKLINALQQLRVWRLIGPEKHLQFLNDKGDVVAEFVALSP
jgi:heat shock protein HslJ